MCQAKKRVQRDERESFLLNRRCSLVRLDLAYFHKIDLFKPEIAHIGEVLGGDAKHEISQSGDSNILLEMQKDRNTHPVSTAESNQPSNTLDGTRCRKSARGTEAEASKTLANKTVPGKSNLA